MTEDTLRISAGDNSDNKVYHTRDCVNLPDRTRVISREQADRRDLRECKHCADEVEYPSTNKPALRYQV